MLSKKVLEIGCPKWGKLPLLMVFRTQVSPNLQSGGHQKVVPHVFQRSSTTDLQLHDYKGVTAMKAFKLVEIICNKY